MARLACSRCGAEVGVQEVDCPRCGLILLGPGTTVELPVPLVPEPARPAPEPARPAPEPARPAPDLVEPSPRAAAPVRGEPPVVACPRCGEPLPDPEAQVCVWCLRQVRSVPADAGRPVVRRVVVRFENGEVELSPGRTVLGRAPSSPAASVLAGYDNVSRFHARIDVHDVHEDGEDGEVRIRDENSSNGTFVDGRRLRPGESARLVEGTRLRLASNVEARLRFERPGGAS